MKKLLLLLGIVFASSVNAPLVFSATVSSQNGLDTSYGQSAYANTFYAPATTTSLVGIQPNNTTPFYTTTATTTVLRLKHNGWSGTYTGCEGAGGGDFVTMYANGGGYTSSQGVETVVGYCDFTFVIPPSKALTAFHFSNPEYYGMINFYGSLSNAGSTYDFNGNIVRTGGLWYQLSDNGTFATSSCSQSCITSLTPLNNSTTTSPVSFSLDYYIHPDDIGDIKGIRVELRNIDQNTILGELTEFFNPNDIYFIENLYPTASGYYSFSSSTVNLAEGNYRIQAELTPTAFNFFSNIFNFNSWVTVAHNFIVGSTANGYNGTFIGNISQQSFQAIQGLYASTTATSTISLSGSCNVLSGFSVNNCLAYLFIPDGQQINDTFKSFKSEILTRFPMGYVTDFFVIMSTSTIGSLTVIDATIPAGIAGAGANIHLDLNNVLDQFLYATTSQFVNASAPDTRTFYEITYDYWEKIVYFLLIMYLISRILGSGLIPTNWSQTSGKYAENIRGKNRDIRYHNAKSFHKNRKK